MMRLVIMAGCIIGALGSGELDAATVSYTVTGTVNKMVTLYPTNTTIGTGIPNCTMLTGLSQRLAPANNVLPNANVKTVYYLATNLNAVEVCVGQQPGYKIYKTNIDGIGISYNDADSASQTYGKPIPPWSPNTSNILQKFTQDYLPGGLNIDPWVSVRLWRYSSATDTLPYGQVAVTGPEVYQTVGPVAGDTFGTCNTKWTGDQCIVNEIIPRITTAIYSGTCEFVNAAKTVQMGKRNIPTNASEGYGTQWVDASFRLNCPAAYGSYQDPANTSTATQNKAITIKVVPRTTVINTDKGIFALDGTGAQGVGIQLAWGDYASQNSGNPTKPVKLNTATDASTISNNIAAGPFAVGSGTVSGDGSVKMAARYVRTTGTVQPGPANAIVEIFANYE
ncbi:fimbrial protein [Phytobacter diazotrophicus]|uniref:fimbrial protein n=1 Tax=Phytobacter diazotrophicus TaxID=395631 RepID=UPI002936989D|nr:fimbrial protein [Phytobacter diazotrophicus]MDV2902892.1 fimbrial protein [Phytobacter diazotrophicus]